MKPIICLLFLSMTALCHAQKTPKNELSIGYFTSGYFFDSTDLKFSKFIRGKNLSFSYTRNIDKHWFLNAGYLRSSFGYLKSPVPDYLEDNTVVYRYLKGFSGSVGYKLSKWSMAFKAKIGIHYRFKFEKGVHFTYVDGGNWREPRGGIYENKSIGPTFGLTLSHPIVWRLFGEFDCAYARLFSNYPIDQNQLLLSYRIGVRF